MESTVEVIILLVHSINLCYYSSLLGSLAMYVKYSILSYVCAVRNLLPAFRTCDILDTATYYWGDQNMEGCVEEGAVMLERERKPCTFLAGRRAGNTVLRTFF